MQRSEKASSYPMSIFRIPNSLCNEFNSIMANFWWGQKEHERKIHWVSWEKLSLAKQMGELASEIVKSLTLPSLPSSVGDSLLNRMCVGKKFLRAYIFPIPPSWRLKKATELLSLGQVCLMLVTLFLMVFRGRLWMGRKLGYGLIVRCRPS